MPKKVPNSSKRVVKAARKTPVKTAKGASSGSKVATKSKPSKNTVKVPAKQPQTNPKKATAKQSTVKVKAVQLPKSSATIKNSSPSKPAPASKPVAAALTASASVPKPATPGPPRPIKRPKPPQIPLKMPVMGKLLDPKNPHRKPLIPSGPKASTLRPLGSHAAPTAELPKITGKSPFNKRELERFRTLLIRKRMELVGDVNTMENEALLGQSGSLSNTPSHMAEQGSEAYDQSLSLDLAAADRRLIKEIDDALDRIKAGVFGLCQLSGKPIKLDRLEELPWARYSIEAARELERQAMRS